MNSASQHCTLYQLRNLIRRSNVSKKPKPNFDACDEFFKTVVVCHIASAMHFLGMASFDDLSRSSVLPADVWLMDKEQRKCLLKSVATAIVG